MREFVWEIVKFSICECSEVLCDKHMDHIVICAIYAVAKKSAFDISFNTIIKK